MGWRSKTGRVECCQMGWQQVVECRNRQWRCCGGSVEESMRTEMERDGGTGGGRRHRQRYQGAAACPGALQQLAAVLQGQGLLLLSVQWTEPVFSVCSRPRELPGQWARPVRVDGDARGGARNSLRPSSGQTPVQRAAHSSSRHSTPAITAPDHYNGLEQLQVP